MSLAGILVQINSLPVEDYSMLCQCVNRTMNDGYPNLETRWTDSQADGNPSNQLQEAGEEEKGLQFTLLKDSSNLKLHDSQMALPR